MRGETKRSAVLPLTALSLYTAMLTGLLLLPQPLAIFGGGGTAVEAAVESTLGDLVEHLLAYALFGGLLVWAAQAAGSARRGTAIFLCGGLVHGVICESLQILIPERWFGWPDLLANVGGIAAVGLIVACPRRDGR